MIDNDYALKMTEAIGPYYDLRGLARWLNQPKRLILERAFDHDILAAVSDDDVIVFPVWQFEADGTINPELIEAAKILYSAEHPSFYSEDNFMLPGAGWFTLYFLTLQFPFTLREEASALSVKDAERKPLYRHLQEGSLLNEAFWEIQDQHHRMTSP